jgi:quercetin dioxygenase-like cupin family protein
MIDGYFVGPRDTTQVEMFPGVHRRTMATTDEAMVCEFTLLADAVVPMHSHSNDQVGYVVSGTILLAIGDQERRLSCGESYAIPGGIQHSARALVDSVLIDVFSPPRADYRTEAR